LVSLSHLHSHHGHLLHFAHPTACSSASSEHISSAIRATQSLDDLSTSINLSDTLDDLAEIRFFVTCDRQAAFREQFNAIEEQRKRSLLCVNHFRFAVCQYQSPSRDTGCSRSVSVSENQQSCMMQYSPIMSTMMMSVIQEAVQALLQRHDHYDVSQLIRIIQKYRKT